MTKILENGTKKTHKDLTKNDKTKGAFRMIRQRVLRRQDNKLYND